MADNPYAAAPEPGKSPFRMAIVTGVFEDGVTLQFSPETEAEQKRYMRFSGCAVKAGDKAACARFGDTWVVMSPVTWGAEGRADFAGVAARVENNDDLKALRFSVKQAGGTKQVLINHPDFGWIQIK